MSKLLKKITFLCSLASFFLISVDTSLGQTVNIQRDKWVVEGKARLKKEEQKESQDFRDISSKDERGMLCLFSRNSCVEKCRKTYKEVKEDSEKTKEQGYQTLLFLKRKCILTCNWNRDICIEEY